MAVSVLRRKMAETIRAERARQGLSQAQVAQTAGVAPRRIVQIENGSSDPRFSTVARITEALGLTITVDGAA